MKVVFEEAAADAYYAWFNANPKTAKRIMGLIQDIRQNGLMNGIGKPEKLKNDQGYSRRIDDKNRLIYTVDEKQNLVIISCKGHYDDK